MKKPIYNAKQDFNKIYIDVRIDSIIVDENWFWHFYIKKQHIKIADEFADLP